MKKLLLSIIAFCITLPMLAQVTFIKLEGTYPGKINIGLNSLELKSDLGREATVVLSKGSQADAIDIVLGGFQFAAFDWKKIELKNVKYQLTNEGYTFQTEEVRILEAEVFNRQNQQKFASISVLRGAKGTVKNGVLELEMTIKYRDTSIYTKFVSKNITTGIQTVQAEDEKQEVIYDITGKRVKQACKGIYIINGKKVLVK